MKAGEGLTGRYCLLQGSYYGVNCAVIGYASVFLLERGMSPAGIGALIAAGNVLSAVLQPMTAGIADRSGRVTLKQMIRLAAAASNSAVSTVMATVPQSCRPRPATVRRRNRRTSAAP